MDSVDSMNRLSGFKNGLISEGRRIEDIEMIVSEMSIAGSYQSVMEHSGFFMKKRCVYVYNDMIASGMLMAFKDFCISRFPNKFK